MKRWILVEKEGVPHTQAVRGRLPPVGGGLLLLGGWPFSLRGWTLPVGADMFPFQHLKECSELCRNEVINSSNK